MLKIINLNISVNKTEWNKKINIHRKTRRKKKTVSRTVTVNRQFLNIFFYNVTCHNNKKQQTWLMQFHIAIDTCSKMGILYKIEPNHENSHFVLISPPVSFVFTISFSHPLTKIFTFHSIDKLTHPSLLIKPIEMTCKQ